VPETLKTDPWIAGFDGIGHLLSLHPMFIEEFHKTYSEGAGIGEAHFTRAHYKLFCNFNGSLRKRDHFKDCNADYCSNISTESEKIVKRLISENPENYKRYQKLEPKKNVVEKTELWLHLDKKLKNEVVSQLDSFISTTSGDFSYIDVIEHMKGTAREFARNPYSFSDNHESTNFLLTLINPGIRIENNRQGCP